MGEERSPRLPVCVQQCVLTQVSPVQHVEHTPRGPHNDMGRFHLQLLNFSSDVCPPYASVAGGPHVVPESHDHLLDLSGGGRGGERRRQGQVGTRPKPWRAFLPLARPPLFPQHEPAISHWERRCAGMNEESACSVPARCKKPPRSEALLCPVSRGLEGLYHQWVCSSD